MQTLAEPGSLALLGTGLLELGGGGTGSATEVSLATTLLQTRSISGVLRWFASPPTLALSCGLPSIVRAGYQREAGPVSCGRECGNAGQELFIFGTTLML